jgi:hypothetical protein
LRQAYDYWQDQPGYYLERLRNEFQSLGIIIEFLFKGLASTQYLIYRMKPSLPFDHLTGKKIARLFQAPLGLAM